MLEDALEVLATQHEQRRIFHGDDVRRPRLVVDQRHLTEELPFAEDGENDLAAIFADQDDFDLTFRDDVQRVAGIVLEQDDGVFGIRTVARDFNHPLQVDGCKLAEERDLLQHVRGGHANTLRRAASRVN